ncbi:uncharacterized protein N7496_002887 [Penicillium cataractarum]|uniref:Inhibitor I9 domain-containing protein n=1 Tax=Penicillium cataractarum TaxID=2100454 RepID=A0A9W9SML6_9EURO|nr:uncharacterized protein N7496_002887 [Penicillium cataractarum]KAJ5380459.1 hypothetical protein N7496_002887 [Penicillium cataractarum]
MPLSYNVTLKPDASPEKLEAAKEEAIGKGGTIQHEYSLIKGFVFVTRHDIILLWAYLLSLVRFNANTSSPSSVEFPDDHVDTLESNDHVHVEKDAEVKTQ